VSQDLAQWLLTQIAEDEKMAAGYEGVPLGSIIEYAEDSGPYWLTISARRVLAECEAKRRIIALHGYDESLYDNKDEDEPRYCLACGDSDYEVGPYPCDTVRLLALPYADRPGYQEEWRP
jgi:hypothetical protein